MKYEVTLTKAYDFEVDATSEAEALAKVKEMVDYTPYISEVQEVEE